MEPSGNRDLLSWASLTSLCWDAATRVHGWADEARNALADRQAHDGATVADLRVVLELLSRLYAHAEGGPLSLLATLAERTGEAVDHQREGLLSWMEAVERTLEARVLARIDERIQRIVAAELARRDRAETTDIVIPAEDDTPPWEGYGT